MVKKSLQLNKKQTNLLIIVGAILVTLALAFALAMPVWKKMQKTSEELKQERVRLERLEDKLAHLKVLKEKEAELKEKNEKVLAALPKDKDVSRLFVQFENIAIQSGLTISQASEGEESTATSTKGTIGSIIPITYKVTGKGDSYAAVRDAFSRFENALRLVSVSSVDINRNNNTFDLAYTLVTYVRGGEK